MPAEFRTDSKSDVSSESKASMLRSLSDVAQRSSSRASSWPRAGSTTAKAPALFDLAALCACIFYPLVSRFEHTATGLCASLQGRSVRWRTYLTGPYKWPDFATGPGGLWTRLSSGSHSGWSSSEQAMSTESQRIYV